MVSSGAQLNIKLEDKMSGALFANCPVESYPGFYDTNFVGIYDIISVVFQVLQLNPFPTAHGTLCCASKTTTEDLRSLASDLV